MNIYKYAVENPHADYMDMNTGYIYKIPEYVYKLKYDPEAKIRVVDSLDGATIGYARKDIR